MVPKSRYWFPITRRRVCAGYVRAFSIQSQSVVSIIKDFRRMGVKKVAPCHCTGENAIALFEMEYGQDFIQIGVGSVIRLD